MKNYNNIIIIIIILVIYLNKYFIDEINKYTIILIVVVEP
jgi:hypothetical protein